MVTPIFDPAIRTDFNFIDQPERMVNNLSSINQFSQNITNNINENGYIVPIMFTPTENSNLDEFELTSDEEARPPLLVRARGMNNLPLRSIPRRNNNEVNFQSDESSESEEEYEELILENNERLQKMMSELNDTSDASKFINKDEEMNDEEMNDEEMGESESESESEEDEEEINEEDDILIDFYAIQMSIPEIHRRISKIKAAALRSIKHKIFQNNNTISKYHSIQKLIIDIECEPSQRIKSLLIQLRDLLKSINVPITQDTSRDFNYVIQKLTYQKK